MYGSLLPAIAECNLNLYFQILTAEAFFNCKIPVFQFQILLVEKNVLLYVVPKSLVGFSYPWKTSLVEDP